MDARGIRYLYRCGYREDLHTAKSLPAAEDSAVLCAEAVAAAARVAARPESQGKTLAVILPDGGERYLSTALFPD